MENSKLKKTLFASSIIDIVTIVLCAVCAIVMIVMFGALIGNANNTPADEVGAGVGQAVGAVVGIIFLMIGVIMLAIVVLYAAFAIPSMKLYKLPTEEVILKQGRLTAGVVIGALISLFALGLSIALIFTDGLAFLGLSIPSFALVLTSTALKIKAIRLAKLSPAKQ